MLIAEVAREARVSVSSVRHWLRTGKLNSVRPARRRLIARDEFERFMKGLEEAAQQAKRRGREAP
jgi:excisionase family DNA binding protein